MSLREDRPAIVRLAANASAGGVGIIMLRLFDIAERECFVGAFEYAQSRQGMVVVERKKGKKAEGRHQYIPRQKLCYANLLNIRTPRSP